MKFDPLTEPLGMWSMIGFTYDGDMVCCGANVAAHHHNWCPTTPIFAKTVIDFWTDPLHPSFWPLDTINWPWPRKLPWPTRHS